MPDSLFFVSPQKGRYACPLLLRFVTLGFTFYLGRSLRGKVIPKVKTSGKRLRSKLKKVNEWACGIRNQKTLGEIWKTFRAKLRGHVQYYGVSFNSKSVAIFLSAAERIMFKWLNRRSQRKSFTTSKDILSIILKVQTREGHSPEPIALIGHDVVLNGGGVSDYVSLPASNLSQKWAFPSTC